ncbi:MAG: hypothetical protein J1E56_06480 [Ruminococcus sp.]|nr:hypothetical protein [Ruminococcus sp.]
MLANAEIRKVTKLKGVRLWEVANALNISEPTMTRKLRKELPDKEKQTIFKIIDEIAAEKENAAD